MNRIEKMKLGRRRAYLRKCLLAQSLSMEFENQTTIRRRVFTEHIKPMLLCSYQQYNNMLNEINPQRELESIEEKIKNL